MGHLQIGTRTPDREEECRNRPILSKEFIDALSHAMEVGISQREIVFLVNVAAALRGSDMESSEIVGRANEITRLMDRMEQINKISRDMSVG